MACVKLIYNVTLPNLPEAQAIIAKELADYARRYAKPGWGWTFAGANGPSTYFVRGIKGGLSITEKTPKTEENT